MQIRIFSTIKWELQGIGFSHQVRSLVLLMFQNSSRCGQSGLTIKTTYRSDGGRFQLNEHSTGQVPTAAWRIEWP